LSYKGWIWWRHEVGLGPGSNDSVCLSLILQPISPASSLCLCTCVHLFFLSSILGVWRWVAVTAMCGWQPRMCAGPSLCILLAMAGIPTVSRGWHPCAQACLFVFPPPLVGAELGCEGGGCKYLFIFFLQAFLPRRCLAADFVGVRSWPPLRGTKDTHDNVSHKARFISSQLGSGYLPDAAGFNKDPKYKVQAAFIFFRH
jgi:hypothetical protein